MNKPQRIKGTQDYSYKGSVIGKYSSAKGGVRWNVCKNGSEIRFDIRTLWSAVDYIDQH